MEFAQWLQNSGVPRSVEPTCHSPKRLADKQITNIAIMNLACLPQVEPATTLINTRSSSSSDALLKLVLQEDDKSTRNSGKLEKKDAS